ncbi:recombination mediator RecR [Spectribacter hydrogenoxidans]|uniref:Recombination protein RecR n=1 Tax=Spectribacter hydrogenoxidans TaxID=3075608 RepID=A0ABU3C1K4_9GAMM|nr:recombination mediator RecR [Salinisphaera sp. W335]MDT0635425.1 recombination mediator RecR [Salinisphaera sp. W335]
MAFAPALDALIDAFRVLPGVGQKTAQRMAFHLLQSERQGGQRLAQALGEALERVGHCRQCRMFAEDDICDICRSSRRDARVLCVVESPADVLAVEQNTDFRGRYFVLMGHLSPIDGIGPEELGLDQLRERLRDGEVKELILATGATVEGDATASYIGDLAARHGASATRIAHGVPVGGELEYVDAGTLAQAFSGRRQL